MSRAIRLILAVIFVLLITFGAISICQNLGKRLKVDVTDQKLYTLSAGTKSILAKLNQPLKLKLYYAKTASMKGPDQIKYFNNYYEFVKALLEEYVAASKGMVTLEIIDPRPFSDDEVEATRSGLKRFPITEEENFVFGLVVQTQFGVEKTIPFFAPDRQNFVEYDISSSDRYRYRASEEKYRRPQLASGYGRSKRLYGADDDDAGTAAQNGLDNYRAPQTEIRGQRHPRRYQ